MKYGIRIVALSITDFQAADAAPTDIKAPRGTLTITANVRVKKSEKSLAVKISIQYYLESAENVEQQPIFVGSIDTYSEFIISDWDKWVEEKANIFSVEEDLKLELIRISYDTTRGLIRERGKDHLIGKIVLPVFDPREIPLKQVD